MTGDEGSPATPSSPLIGQGVAGRDINIVQKASIGAIGVAIIVAVAIMVTSLFSDPEVRIDPGVVLSVAQAQGYVSPEEAELLVDKVERAEVDLERLRQAHPDWKAEIDAAVEAFNKGDFGDASEAFARIDALIAARRAELRAEEARSKYTQATLFHPFEYSKSAPLLCEAAELAASEIWYWIECGRARIRTGNLALALTAFEAARDLARDVEDERDRSAALDGIGDVRRAQGQLDAALEAYTEGLDIRRALAAQDPGNAGWARDVSVSLDRVGDVRRAQGQLDAALEAYTEGLDIRRALAAQDPGNAGWARDVFVSLWRMAQVDRANAAEHWSEVVNRMKDMKAKGILLPGDEPFLETAQQELKAARQ